MRLTILQKLALFVTAISAVMLVFGAFNYFLFNHFDRYVNVTAKLNDLITYTEKIRESDNSFNLWDVKNSTFFETGQSEYIQSFDENVQSAKTILAEMKESALVKNYDYQEDINEIEILLNSYESKFKELVEAKTRFGFEDYGLVGRMREAIHQIESQLTESDLQVYMLTLRRHEKDYLLRRDLQYQNRFNSVAAQMKVAMTNDYSLPTNLIDQYQSTFAELVTLDQAIGLDLNQGLSGEVQAAIVSLNEKQNELVANIESGTDQSRTSYAYLIYAAVGIGILLSVFGSYLFSRSLRRSFTGAFEAIQSVTKGNLDVGIDTSSQDEIGMLLLQLKTMVEKLREIVSVVITSSQSIANASQEMSRSSQVMSEGASDQASSAEEVSSSMEEMAANIEQNTANAKETEGLSVEGASKIEESNEMVKRTLDSMKTITDKISIIGEISRQTNLLALNAAVEAARAGEHGKGFAVVAAEIRRLAERSQVAAKEIDEESMLGIEIAQASMEVLDKIVPEIKRTAELVGQIASASIEQNSGADQINNAIQNLNNVVQQNAAVAEEIAASSEELSNQANVLSDAISFFTVEAEEHMSSYTFEGAEEETTEEASTEQKEKNVKEASGIEIDLGEGPDVLDTEFEKF